LNLFLISLKVVLVHGILTDCDVLSYYTIKLKGLAIFPTNNASKLLPALLLLAALLLLLLLLLVLLLKLLVKLPLLLLDYYIL